MFATFDADWRPGDTPEDDADVAASLVGLPAPTDQRQQLQPPEPPPPPPDGPPPPPPPAAAAYAAASMC
eukprot:SAG22_NODE_12772_length_429_cov_16.778788_1_plen_68_part_01